MFYTDKTQLRFSLENVAVEETDGLGYIISINSTTGSAFNIVSVTTKVPGEYETFKPKLDKLVSALQKEAYFWFYDRNASQYKATVTGVQTMSDLPSNRLIDEVTVTLSIKHVA